MPPTIPANLRGKFGKLGIHTPFDLVLHLPLRYENETKITRIADLVPGEQALVEGEIRHAEVVFRPRRTLLCQLKDDSGLLTLRFFHFYPNQQKQLAIGKRIRALGEVRHSLFGSEMVHPKCTAVEASTPLRETLTPIYPTVGGLAQGTLRKYILAALEELALPDTLPHEIRERLHLPEFASCAKLLHQPPPHVDEHALLARTHPAWMRIKFDELLAQQLSMRMHYRERAHRSAPPLAASGDLVGRLVETLPFTLTRAQQTAWQEICADLARPHPMQRLLQGDVGSGKTIIATLAALQAIENGYQAAFMAPTELLAEQHYRKLREWLLPLGITPVWLCGSLKKRERDAAIARIGSGETPLAIGTHALFQKEVTFHKLGLIIVDEQHKFGVAQRLALRNKGSEPHQLMMSATPIPRTLAMSYYADLDVSVINELPPGRTPVQTRLISDTRREEVFARVRTACLAGRQVYWVCPLIEESETLQLQTALETHATLSRIFPGLRIGLVHGRLKPEERASTMAAFQAGELQLLVATTVIEVGVDVPNASIMVIDHAERMGLAQLHQLRGRVGRGAAESLCVLLYSQPLSELARARLKIIYEHTDGFEIAQHDLRLRGPGELLGARQSGMPMLRFADLIQDEALLYKARAIADEMLRDFPGAAEAHLQRWMANRQDYLRT